MSSFVIDVRLMVYSLVSSLYFSICSEVALALPKLKSLLVSYIFFVTLPNFIPLTVFPLRLFFITSVYPVMR